MCWLADARLASCRRHGLNPFDYLKDLFTRLGYLFANFLTRQFTALASSTAKTFRNMRID
jgi:hypothetical protein